MNTINNETVEEFRQLYMKIKILVFCHGATYANIKRDIAGFNLTKKEYKRLINYMKAEPAEYNIIHRVNINSSI